MAKSANKKKSNQSMANWRYFDYTLLFVVLFLVCFGLVMIYSTSAYSSQIEMGDSFYYVKRQGLIAGGGFVILIIVSMIDYHKYIRFIMPAYIGTIILLVIVATVGTVSHGQRRWIYITEGIGFQPSEMAKVVLILFLAYFSSRSVRRLQTFKGVIGIFLWCLPIIGLVVYSNLSTGIIIFAIAFVIIFVTSSKYKPFIALVVGGIGVLGVGLMLFSYRVGRIEAWLNVETHPDAYQTRQALYAIGSGGLFGKGLGRSLQKLEYVPEAHNDMIFSIICEELGLFGAVAIILLFGILLWRCMIIANNAPDLFGSLIVVGVMAQIGIQVIINIAVVTNTMPNTGIPLPFISYGGTSVIFLLIEIGLVLNVSRSIKIQR